MPALSEYLRVALVTLGAIANMASADCQNSPINGISYCKAVDSILYTSIGSGGTYQDVIGMDSKTCKCDTKPTKYSGPMAPLDEQMSLHFRGPLRLKQVAVYYPSESSHAKRQVEKVYYFNKVRGGHRHHNYPTEKITVMSQSGGNYKRTGYYNAEKGILQGLTFMNHMGGPESGTWDKCWGNSLSYAGAHCNKASSKPEVLADIPIKSGQEFVIFTDQKCDNDCGYYRPGIPAYRGFDGKEKIFAFEFSMPHEYSASGPNPNMPSIWGLNAKIPRTGQYSACSCWKSGCGEFDFFEVLQNATKYVKSHFHANQGAGYNGRGGGGSPDYFDRPCQKTIKAAAIFSKDGTVKVKILPNDVEFSSSIDCSLFRKSGEKKAVSYKVPT